MLVELGGEPIPIGDDQQRMQRAERRVQRRLKHGSSAGGTRGGSRSGGVSSAGGANGGAAAPGQGEGSDLEETSFLAETGYFAPVQASLGYSAWHGDAGAPLGAEDAAKSAVPAASPSAGVSQTQLSSHGHGVSVHTALCTAGTQSHRQPVYQGPRVVYGIQIITTNKTLDPRRASPVDVAQSNLLDLRKAQ